MSINDALDHACEVYVSRIFEVFIESVAAAEDNEASLTAAAERFKTGVNLAMKVLAKAKQIAET
jgi:hypothetical protein